MSKQYLEGYRLTSRILNRFSSTVMIAFVLLAAWNVVDAAAQAKGDVKLVLQVTVDGLRTGRCNCRSSCCSPNNLLKT